MTFHNIQPVGDTMARATNDVREINFMFSPGINLVVGSLTFLVMPFFFAPQYDPSLLLTPILFSVAYFIALWQYLHTLGPVTSAVRDAFGVMNSRLAEALDGIETVKSASQEEAEVKRFNQNAGTVSQGLCAPGRPGSPFRTHAVDGDGSGWRPAACPAALPPGSAGYGRGGGLLWACC